jgi:NADH:ubiquinone oxidoreductase subunit E/NAD-dependent dihydropyrimidine dehydrogenase PreA subunit
MMASGTEAVPGTRKKKVGAVAVIGGGIGGMETAISLAESGYRVYLVEKNPSIGGTMSQLDKTFPTNDCAMCTLAPKLVGTARQRNIQLLTNAELVEVEGEPGNFRIKVFRKPRYVDVDKCTGCGTCMESCPVRNTPQIPAPPKVSSTMDPEKRARYDKIMDRYPDKLGTLLPILQDINSEYHYLPEDALRYVSEILDIPLSKVFHVATFFTAFSLKPRGRHTIKVCLGTACHVRGSPKVLEAISRKLGIAPGETTADGEVTLETVNCLGACALGPTVMVDEEYHPMTVGKIDQLLKKYGWTLVEKAEAPETTADQATKEAPVQ